MRHFDIEVILWTIAGLIAAGLIGAYIETL